MKNLALYLLLLLLLAYFVCGEGTENITEENANQTKVINETINENITQNSLKLEIVLKENLSTGVIYNSLFKITNLNYSPGIQSYVFVIVSYNITNGNQNNSLVTEDYFNKTINHYSSSGTGRLLIDETRNYTLCGSIINTSISICKDFEVINPLTIPCFVELNLSTDKEIYNEGESVKIKNSISNQAFPFIIQYWAEDLFGSIIKEKQNTSNTNLKSFTPKIKEKDKVFLVKNQLVFVGCNNSNYQLSNEKMIISLNKDYEPETESKKTASEKSDCANATANNNSSAKKAKSEESAEIVSFYTRSKNYNQSINLYANVKASRGYQLSLLSSKGEQKLNFNGSNNIRFRVEPEPGINLFVLRLRKNDKLVDSRELFIKLESNNAVKENKTNVSKNPLSGQNNSYGINGFEGKNFTNEDSNEITGMVAYESPNIRIQKYLPYLLLSLIVLIATGLLLLKKR